MEATVERKRATKPRASKLSEAEQELKALRAYVKKVTSSNEDSRNLLRRAGIVNKNGELTQPYRA